LQVRGNSCGLALLFAEGHTQFLLASWLGSKDGGATTARRRRDDGATAER